MIKRETFEEAHIKELHQISRRNPQLIERSLYALGLLEALSVVRTPDLQRILQQMPAKICNNMPIFAKIRIFRKVVKPNKFKEL